MQVHERIEEIRKSKGVTKTHIAKKCNKTVSWYYGISKGKRTLNVQTLQEIADALEVDVKNFFDEKISDTLKNEQEVS